VKKHNEVCLTIFQCLLVRVNSKTFIHLILLFLFNLNPKNKKKVINKTTKDFNLNLYERRIP